MKSRKKTSKGPKIVKSPKIVKHELVFAYGSNMNAYQMRFRCPGARAVSVARLRNHRLMFAGQSARWGGGVATIKPARRGSVVGVVWSVSRENLERLDGFEGYPYVYDRVPVCVERAEKLPPLWCYAYVKNSADAATPPSREYLRTILDGYDHVGAAVPLSLRRLYNQAHRGLAL